ncbi:hypothetical protein EDC01DRAFT_632276 [Geopyxis carbonaria]|nr:hypothetical protein EDC01DRAFT_632276 [Geopyxis carbonaria]
MTRISKKIATTLSSAKATITRKFKRTPPPPPKTPYTFPVTVVEGLARLMAGLTLDDQAWLVRQLDDEVVPEVMFRMLPMRRALVAASVRRKKEADKREAAERLGLGKGVAGGKVDGEAVKDVTNHECTSDVKPVESGTGGGDKATIAEAQGLRVEDNAAAVATTPIEVCLEKPEVRGGPSSKGAADTPGDEGKDITGYQTGAHNRYSSDEETRRFVEEFNKKKVDTLVEYYQLRRQSTIVRGPGNTLRVRPFRRQQDIGPQSGDDHQWMEHD